MRVTVASNTAWSLVNFRGGVIRALVERGDEVIAVAPPDGQSARLAEMGCRVVDLPMDNKGTNPLRDLGTVRRFRGLYRALRPDVAMHFTIKPMIYGSLAARLAGVPCINTATGLGTAFIRENWLTRVVEGLYRVSQRWPERVFFQNPDDRALFLERRLVAEDKTGLLPGSGVDLGRFEVTELPEGDRPVFLLVARMLWDKGIGEFVEAARQVRAHYPQAVFRLLGPVGVANRTAIGRETLDAWVDEGTVEYAGETDDVRPFLREATCVVLPSYREGTPRTLLEAASMGRPIITTDAVGCREVVDDGVSGYLCQVKEADDLARQMIRFLEMSPEERAGMGLAGRAKIEREFDENIVIERYLGAVDALAGRRES